MVECHKCAKFSDFPLNISVPNQPIFTQIGMRVHTFRVFTYLEHQCKLSFFVKSGAGINRTYNSPHASDPIGTKVGIKST